MNINKDELQNKIIDIVKKWDLSGHTFVMKDAEVITDYHYGFDDRDKNIKKDPNAPYVFHWEEPLFVGMCILMLIDQKKVNLDDTLDQYIPEYIHASKITIFNMLKELSGIKDFYHNDIMVKLEEDQVYNTLSDKDKLIKDKTIFHQSRSFENVMKLIADKDLEYLPGTFDEEYSASNWPILAEVVRRVTKVKIYDYLYENVFAPLKMSDVKVGSETTNVSYTLLQNKTLVPLPMIEGVDDLFTMSVDDVKKLLTAFTYKQIFSKKLWKTILKYDENNNGILFENANGFSCRDSNYLSYGAHMYFNQESKIAFASVSNEDQKLKYEGDSFNYFRKEFREAVTTLTTYPINTKIVAVNKKNFWYAKELSVTQEQKEFVLDAKSSIGMVHVYKTKKAYVQMEGDTAVGLLVLDIDPKKDLYYINIIIVDQKFQGRGYGKHMVKFAVDKLTKAGAKKLTIGVARANIAAKKIYLNAGFKPHSVSEEGMELLLNIEDSTKA